MHCEIRAMPEQSDLKTSAIKRLLKQRVPLWQEVLFVGLFGVCTFLLKFRVLVGRDDAQTAVRLDQFVRQVRSELEQMEADRVKEGRDAVFQVGDFDLEV